MAQVTYMAGDGKAYPSFAEALAHDPAGHKRRSTSRVTVSRPATVEGSRVSTVSVDGRPVGRIRGYTSTGETPRVMRAAKWAVILDVDTYSPETGTGREPGIVAESVRYVDAVTWAQTWEGWPAPRRWISGSGSYGCLFDYGPNCHARREYGIEGLVDLFELGNGRKARELRKYGYVRLGRDYGADYAEVTEYPCDCEVCQRLTVGDEDYCEVCDNN